MREIEKVLKRFKASLLWLMEQIGMRDEKIEKIKENMDMDEREKRQMLVAERLKSIAAVLEDVECAC